MGRRKRVGGAVGAAIGAAGKAAAPQGRPRRKKIRAKLDMRKMCLLDNILKRGWMLMDPEETDDEEEEDEGNKRWNFYWATVQTVRYIFHEKKSRLRSDQRINHFPSHFELTRKDLLVKHCKQYRKDMERKGLPCPEIVPITYYLPQDYGIFADECRRRPDWTWIVKPVGKAQGKGIFLVNKISQAKRFHPSNLKRNDFDPKSDESSREEMYVVSQYIDKPLLICGKKFDVRLYVLVVSFHPLIVYIHQKGFARFCSVEYTFGDAGKDGTTYKFEEREPHRKSKDNRPFGCDPDGSFSRGDVLNAMGVTQGPTIVDEGKSRGSNDITSLDMHLTNVSLQKHHEEYSDSHGGKWPLHLLIQYLRSTRGPAATERCLSRIRDLIYHSLRAVQRAMTSPEQCFELYGYDVLLDDNLTPWLIEVNASPSLSATTEADRRMKSTVISDMLDIVVPETTPMVPIRSQVAEPRPRPNVTANSSVSIPSARTLSERRDDPSWSRYGNVLNNHNVIHSRIFENPVLPSSENDKHLLLRNSQKGQTKSLPSRVVSNAYHSRANQDIEDGSHLDEQQQAKQNAKRVEAAGSKYRGTVQEMERRILGVNEIGADTESSDDGSESDDEEEDEEEEYHVPQYSKDDEVIDRERKAKKFGKRKQNKPDLEDHHGEWREDDFEWKPHRQNQFELLFDERKAQKKLRVLCEAGLPVDQSYHLRASDESRVGVKTIKQGQLKKDDYSDII